MKDTEQVVLLKSIVNKLNTKFTTKFSKLFNLNVLDDNNNFVFNLDYIWDSKSGERWGITFSKFIILTGGSGWENIYNENQDKFVSSVSENNLEEVYEKALEETYKIITEFICYSACANISSKLKDYWIQILSGGKTLVSLSQRENCEE